MIMHHLDGGESTVSDMTDPLIGVIEHHCCLSSRPDFGSEKKRRNRRLKRKTYPMVCCCCFTNWRDSSFVRRWIAIICSIKAKEIRREPY
jgi:hypothetical protein